ncbi:hypothetical protein D9M71_837510 [compost metagenome]
MRASLGLGHDLDAHAPFWELASLDRFEQVALGVIRIGTRQPRRLCRCKILDALLGLVVPLHPMTLARGVDQAVSVAAEAVHVTIAVGNAPVGEQNGDLV